MFIVTVDFLYTNPKSLISNAFCHDGYSHIMLKPPFESERHLICYVREINQNNYLTELASCLISQVKMGEQQSCVDKALIMFLFNKILHL